MADDALIAWLLDSGGEDRDWREEKWGTD